MDEYVKIQDLREKYSDCSLKKVYQIQPQGNICHIKEVGEFEETNTKIFTGSFTFNWKNQEMQAVLGEILYDYASLVEGAEKRQYPFIELAVGKDKPILTISTIFNPEENLPDSLNELENNSVKGSYSMLAYKENLYQQLEKIEIFPGTDQIVEKMISYLHLLLE